MHVSVNMPVPVTTPVTTVMTVAMMMTAAMTSVPMSGERRHWKQHSSRDCANERELAKASPLLCHYERQ